MEESTTQNLKRKRPLRTLSPSEKVRAIERIHSGETKSSVSRDIGVPESTLRGWCKNEQKIRFLCCENVGKSNFYSATAIKRPRPAEAVNFSHSYYYGHCGKLKTNRNHFIIRKGITARYPPNRWRASKFLKKKKDTNEETVPISTTANVVPKADAKPEMKNATSQSHGNPTCNEIRPIIASTEVLRTQQGDQDEYCRALNAADDAWKDFAKSLTLPACSAVVLNLPAREQFLEEWTKTLEVSLRFIALSAAHAAQIP